MENIDPSCLGYHNRLTYNYGTVFLAPKNRLSCQKEITFFEARETVENENCDTDDIYNKKRLN